MSFGDEPKPRGGGMMENPHKVKFSLPVPVIFLILLVLAICAWGAWM